MAGHQVSPRVCTTWAKLFSLHDCCVLLDLRVKSYLRTTNLFDSIMMLNVAGILSGGIVILFHCCSSNLCVIAWHVSVLGRGGGVLRGRHSVYNDMFNL